MIHSELIAFVMDQCFIAEVSGVARWAANNTVVADFGLTFRALNFERRVAVPLDSAFRAGCWFRDVRHGVFGNRLPDSRRCASALCCCRPGLHT